MLLRFSVANYLSIRDGQELSLVASALKDSDTGLLRGGPAGADRLLPAVVVYGPNGSGKSNFVEAIQFMRSAVLNSHRHGNPAGGTGRRPFVLDKDLLKQPTKMDIDFVVGGVRYHYGFEADDTAFISEWLYTFPSDRRQTLFTRQGHTFEFGRSLRGRNKVIEDLTRPNSLFVSAAAQNDHEQLSIIGTFFQSIHVQDNIVTLQPRPTAVEKLDERVISFLIAIGTGVVSYRQKEIEVTGKAAELAKAFLAVIRKTLGEGAPPTEELETSKLFQLELGHRARDGSVVFLTLHDESAGTQRLVSMLGTIFRSLDNGTPVVVDELNASLHTLACEALLALFASPSSNPKGAQLIATTHDTNLLGSRLLRRDQVWFTEKDNDGATHLFPLTDIHTRKGDNIEKGYLQGRFGAIPFAGSVSELLAGE